MRGIVGCHRLSIRPGPWGCKTHSATRDCGALQTLCRDGALWRDAIDGWGLLAGGFAAAESPNCFRLFELPSNHFVTARWPNRQTLRGRIPSRCLQEGIDVLWQALDGSRFVSLTEACLRLVLEATEAVALGALVDAGADPQLHGALLSRVPGSLRWWD